MHSVARSLRVLPFQQPFSILSLLCIFFSSFGVCSYALTLRNPLILYVACLSLVALFPPMASPLFYIKKLNYFICNLIVSHFILFIELILFILVVVVVVDDASACCCCVRCARNVNGSRKIALGPLFTLSIHIINHILLWLWKMDSGLLF